MASRFKIDDLRRGVVIPNIAEMFGSTSYLRWDEAPFHTHAGERFEKIFVALHPFASLLGTDTRSVNGFDFSNCRPDSPLYFRVNNRQTGPNLEVEDVDTILKMFGTGHDWASVAKGSALSGHGKVCQAISSAYNRLVDGYGDNNAAEKLRGHVAEHKLIFPDEDYISVFHERAIGKMYQQLLVDMVLIGDQHDGSGKLSVESFFDPARSIHDIADVPFVSYSHDADMNMLTVSDFNKPYTLICLSSEATRIVNPAIELEGFWADADTGADWWWARLEGQ